MVDSIDFLILAAQGRGASFADTLDQHGWSKAVVKPAISAGSFSTRRFTRDQADAAQAFLDELNHDRDTMIQQYMPSIESDGERSLIWGVPQLRLRADVD